MLPVTVQTKLSTKGTKFLTSWCALFAGQDLSIEAHTPSKRAYRMGNPEGGK